MITSSNQTSPGKNTCVVEQVGFIHYSKGDHTLWWTVEGVSETIPKKGLIIEVEFMLGGFRERFTEVKFYSGLGDIRKQG